VDSFFDLIHSFSARGQNVDFWLLSKNNTGSLPLRGNPAGKQYERNCGDVPKNFDRFDPERPTLQGHSRSLEPTPNDRPLMTSYWYSIVTMGVSPSILR